MSVPKLKLGLPDVPPPGPTKEVVDESFSPRDLPMSVWEVYNKLGGAEWLFQQAQAKPEEFMKMLKTLMPKNINLAGVQDITVKIGNPFPDGD